MAHAHQRARRGDSTTSRRRIDTPRNAPSDAAAERALLFTPAVPRRLVGPHAWSRARVDRLAPRKEPKPSGEGSPFTTALRAGVVLPHPKKLVCWGPGGALAARRSWRIQVFTGPRMSALNSRHCPARPPLVPYNLVTIPWIDLIDLTRLGKAARHGSSGRVWGVAVGEARVQQQQRRGRQPPPVAGSGSSEPSQGSRSPCLLILC